MENTSIENVLQVKADLHTLTVTRGQEGYYDEIASVVIKDYIISKSEYASGKALELAELIAFIRRTKYQPVKLSEADEKKNKYGLPDSTIVGSNIIRECEQWATTLLDELRGSHYEAIGIPHKALEDFDIISYIEPYTDDELAEILSFERKMQEVRHIYSPRTKYANKDEFRNPYYGRILKTWYERFAEIGMFKSAQHIERGGAERKGYRQECAFLYDCMAIIGLFELIEVVNKEDEAFFIEEKYNKVRNCIESYKRHISQQRAANAQNV